MSGLLDGHGYVISNGHVKLTMLWQVQFIDNSRKASASQRVFDLLKQDMLRNII